MKNYRTLVVVAHPDDETVGCGGYISKLHHEKNEIFTVYLTDGEKGRFTNLQKKKKESERKIILRKKNAIKASKILGSNVLEKYSGIFEDQNLDVVPLIKITRVIEKIKKEINPFQVITHSAHDLNKDHRTVFEAVLTAFRPKFNEDCRKILSFEIPSSTDYAQGCFGGSFKPNYFINISKFWKKKEQALRAYPDEMLKYPNSRSIEGIKLLNKSRGAQIGVECVEAFELIRYVEK